MCRNGVSNIFQFDITQHRKVDAPAEWVCRLPREFINWKGFTIERTTYRTGSLVPHGHPLQLLNSDMLVELYSPHVVCPQHLSPGGHFHSVLRLAEDFCSGLFERVFVNDNPSEVPDNIIRSFSFYYSLHDDALYSVGQFPVYVTGKREVVLRHEVEGIGM